MIIKYLIFVIVLSIFLPVAFASSFSATVIKEIVDTDNYDDSDAILISNGYLVSRDYKNKALNIWDISDPLNPVFSHSALVGFDNYNRAAAGNNFIVIPKDDTLYIIDMTDKNNIFFRANFTSAEKGVLVGGTNNRFLDDEENVFYILNGDTLSIFDITDKDNPVKRGVLSHPSLSNINRPNIIVGNYLYLTDGSLDTKNNYPGNENFAVVDISNLDAPTFVTAIADSRLHQMGGSVFVEDQNILMLTMGFGDKDDKISVITVLDISDPENPIVTSTTTNSLLYREITFFKVLDNNLYGITAGLSLIKVDISDIADIKITDIDKFGTYADYPSRVFDEVNNIMYISQYSLHKLLVVGISFPDTTTTHKKNGGGCSDCTPPTLGLDKNSNRIVNHGFSYNGNTVQVEKWHTEFPLINATVGVPNLVEIKVYENQGINNMKWVQFCLGAEERGQPLNSCEVLIEVHLLTNGTTTGVMIDDIVINDKDNLIDNDTVTAVSYVVTCMDESPTQECVKVDLEYTYREETINHMMIVNVADKARNSQNFHFNEGVKVFGESVNEPLSITLFEKHASQQKDNLYITYTRVNKIDDTWVDQFGIEYHRINDVTFDRITPADSYECKDPTLDKVKVWKRTNCHFRALTSLWSYN